MVLTGHRAQPAPEPELDKARHVKYWTRCLKTLLPQQYTSLDSNRMYLGYFILAALDVLDALTTSTTPAERQDYINWIYTCQHSNGGFKMWRGADFGDRNTDENVKWDPANVPATYFALVALLVLGDDFKRVKRKETLKWLKLMQRDDGSFGETLIDGRIEGGRDPRSAHCATGARFILRGPEEGSVEVDGETVEDINVDKLVECIRNAESFDGGIADQPFHEPHAGYTFCSLGALSFTNRLNKANSDTPSHDSRKGPSNPSAVIRWLIHRQTSLLDPDASLDSEFLGPSKSAKLSDRELENICTTEAAHPGHDPAAITNNSDTDIAALALSALESDPSAPSTAGMNGRINKVADTCYCWWSTAPLHLLGVPTVYNRAAMRRYLLEKTQHPVLGGFGKFPGDLPDLYHSYLGLVALSLTNDGVGDEVKDVDAGMCVSKEAKSRLKELWNVWGIEST